MTPDAAILLDRPELVDALIAVSKGHPPCWLITPQEVGRIHGVEWAAAMRRWLHFAGAGAWPLIADCGANAADAQAAFAHDLRHVLFTGAQDIAQKLTSIAGKQGGLLLTERPAVLTSPDYADPHEAMRRLLDAGTSRVASASAIGY